VIALPTKEFCDKMMGDKKPVLFRVESREEFILLQEALFAMGYSWRSGEQTPRYVSEWDKIALFLEKGKITKAPHDYNYDNPVRWPEVQPRQSEALLQKMRDGERVAFHPQSAEEAQEMQYKLFNLGFEWISSGKKVSHLQDLSQGTLYAADGVLNFGSTRAQWYNFFTAADLGIGTSVAGTFQTAAGRKQTTEERLVELELQVAMLGRDRARLQEVNAGLRSENAGLKEQLNPQKIEKVAYFPGRGTPSAKSGGPT
jgi:hypothetical protein